MPKVDVNGVELFYELKGSGGEVIAFLNGVAMSTDHWNLQTPVFVKKYQVLLHDFRGQGKSTLKPENFTFEQHASDLKELLDQLEIERVHLVGVSYGAEVGMHFAIMYPERVKSLILGTAVSESQPLLKAMVESWIAAARTYQGELLFKVMAPLIYSNAFYTVKKDWLDRRGEIFGRIVTKEWIDAFTALCKNFLTLNITDRLKEIQSPTLIIAGANDLLKPVCYSKIIHDQISGSQLVVIEEAGHALFLEKAKEFNRVILEFIEKI
ncbi:hypothetical protein BBF96_06815 [Anoxybacter fermentans]|uniref:AB hydrolase-1 domain-containing protein n=1 Tax=Anoxybacter fermentans TaxID=1323375 RepID=A0A3Q9HQ59_9FIRM|nr:alpha/beta hydrolase [Anoxybacter fermentans]AZR73121.1 hypothetical protein BBF96_06815 [Anoxybacter fermentans]